MARSRVPSLQVKIFVCSILLLLLLSNSCSFFRKEESSKKTLREMVEESSDSETRRGQSITREIERRDLEQAKILNKLVEIERVLMENKEKIKNLEKTMRLGFSPKPQKNEVKKDLRKDQKSIIINSLPNRSRAHQKGSSKSLSMRDRYDKNLSAAKDLFRLGRYGKAYLDFVRIEREFSHHISSREPQYWIALCWFKLGEYRTSRKVFLSYIKNNETSERIPSAKYYLAKTEMKLGLGKIAVRHLREIIRDYPLDERSEAARHMLDRVKKAI